MGRLGKSEQKRRKRSTYDLKGSEQLRMSVGRDARQSRQRLLRCFGLPITNATDMRGARCGAALQSRGWELGRDSWEGLRLWRVQLVLGPSSVRATATDRSR